MTLTDTAQQLLSSFSAATSWEQTMRLLMQAGNTLEPLATEELTEANQVRGCESTVWLLANKEDNLWHFKAYSEARIIRGLLAVLLARVNNLASEQIQAIDLEYWFMQLGLAKQLSSSRRDGLRAIFKRVKTISQP